MNIDDLKDLDDEAKERIKILQKITRDEAGGEAFAEAQTLLSAIYYDNRLIAWSIQALELIKKSDSRELYNQAVYNLGVTYEEEKEYSKAIDAFNKVKRSVDLELYSQALISIGIAYFSKNECETAIDLLSRKELDEIPIYKAKAKYNLGVIYQKIGERDKSRETLNQIQRSDNPKTYAEAQYYIGLIYYDGGDLKLARKHWENVCYQDNISIYCQAVVSLGAIDYKEGNEEDAIKKWRSIKYEENAEYFTIAFSKIAKHFMLKQDFNAAEKAFFAACKNNKYENTVYLKIVNFNQESMKIHFYDLFNIVLSIVDVLSIKMSTYINSKNPERKLAHYTSTTTANLLLNYNDKDLPSSFRLNTISNMNDPSEGELLKKHLENSEESTYIVSSFNEKSHAFISCFTFNHDSLNQFRLYGKQNNKEASGVSLVFRQDFFQEQSFDWLPKESTGLKLQQKLVDNNVGVSTSSKLESKKNKVYTIKKLPVMRCVYLEPKSGYIHLAQRNKLTFFKEFLHRDNAETEWAEYQESMSEKTNKVRVLFDDLSLAYKELVKERLVFEYTDPEALKSYNTLLNEILLPLKYLVKHHAFEEEQECRMIYITGLNKPEVKMVYGKFLYVEYEADVKLHLDKVYIAPAANQYQSYLAKLLCDSDTKIELSNNPYRQT